MTNPTVTQVDREAARASARFYLGNNNPFPDDLRSGRVERHFTLDIFARHREEAEKGLREAVAGCREFMRHQGLCGIIGGYGYCTCGMEKATDLLDAALGPKA